MTKTCKKCGTPKNTSEFYSHINTADGFLGACKECCSEYGKSPEVRQRKNDGRRKNHKLDPRRQMLTNARARARKFNLPYDLSVEDILVPTHCPVLGTPIAVNDNQGPSPNSPSLDRVRPDRGYIRGNVRVISHRANAIKNDATLDELLQVVSYLQKETHAIEHPN